MHLPDHRNKYLSVGRFAQAAQLSRKALRLYDELEILLPAWVDPDSGYRYYSTEQLEKARFIRLLRDAEMPLADIRRVLAAASVDEAIQQVVEHRQGFEEKVEEVRRSSQRVLAYLRKENETMSTTVTVENFPARHAISIKRTIRVPAFHQFIPQALEQLTSHAADQGVQLAGDPICFYYGPVNESDDGPVEICFPVEGAVMPGGDIVVREIPAHRAAVAAAGPERSKFPVILEVWDGVFDWVQRNKGVMSEETVPCYEIWQGGDTISVVIPFEEAG